MAKQETTNERTTANSTNGTVTASRTAAAAGAKSASEPEAKDSSRAKALLSSLPVGEDTLKATLRAPQAAATATWDAVRSRKMLVTGVGAATVAAVATSFLIGRRTAMRSAGPLTRATGGRL